MRRYCVGSAVPRAVIPAVSEMKVCAVRYVILFLTLMMSACGGGGDGSAPVVQPAAVMRPVTGQDDTARVQAAVDQGGTVTFAAGTFHLTRTITITKSGTVIAGAGAQTVFDYTPTPLAQIQHCMNDRAFTTPCTFDDPPPRRVGAPIAVGDTSFVATDAADVADIKAGDWLLINDYDSVVDDRVAVDWAQVESVEGLTVNVISPFAWHLRRRGHGFQARAALDLSRLPRSLRTSRSKTSP